MKADNNTDHQNEFKCAAMAAETKKQKDTERAKKLALAKENAKPLEQALKALSKVKGVKIKYNSRAGYSNDYLILNVKMAWEEAKITVEGDNKDKMMNWRLGSIFPDREYDISLNRAIELIASMAGKRFPDQAAEIDKALAKELYGESDFTQQNTFKHATIAAAAKQQKDAECAKKLALAMENAKPVEKALKALSEIKGVNVKYASSTGLSGDYLDIDAKIGAEKVAITVQGDKKNKVFDWRSGHIYPDREYDIKLNRTLKLIASTAGKRFPDQAAKIDEEMAKVLYEHAKAKRGPTAAFAIWGATSECNKKHPETAELPDAAYVASAPEQNNKLLANLFGETAQNDTSSALHFKEPRDVSGQLIKHPPAKRAL